MGWLATRERFLRPGRIRLGFFCVAVLAFFVTEFGRFVYRPYVRRNDISDFGLADSIGNLGGIVVQIFITIAAMNSTKKQSFRIAALLAAGYVGYEFLQTVLPKGVFDWKDVYATLLGLGLSYAILLIIWRSFRSEQAS
jgi:glycopeptide antibiotics resistance protein